MYGVVTVQRAKAKTTGGFEILPFETSLKLIDGKATITEAETDGTGPFYDSVYLFRVQNGYCGHRYGFMVALPDGTTPITTGELPMVDPITGEGIYMDAQEWNELYGELPNRVSAAENRLTLLDGQGQRGYIVKQQAGRTVSVWDYLNNREQLIYGDTGERNITTLFPAVTSGSVFISRTGQTTFLRFIDVVLGTATGTVDIGTIPSGFFTPGTAIRYSLETNSLNRRAMTVYGSGLIRLSGVASGDIFQDAKVLKANTPWPTSLPGVAVGVIAA